MKPELPKAVTYGIETADIGFIGVGLTYGVILEVMDILAERDILVSTIKCERFVLCWRNWGFTHRCKNVFVLEYNAGAQLAKVIIANGGNENNIHSILRYDGVPMNSGDIVKRVIEHLGIKEEEVA